MTEESCLMRVLDLQLEKMVLFGKLDLVVPSFLSRNKFFGGRQWRIKEREA